MSRALVLLLVVPALVACGTPPDSPALACDNPLVIDLGYVTRDRMAWFTTSGGRVRFSVTDPYEGSINFTPDDRTIYVGDVATVPETRSADDSRIVNAVDSVRVDPKRPGSMDLDAGRYWVASYAAPTTMATCSGSAITGVVPAIGTVATTTPSPTADVSPPLPDPPGCTPPGSSCAPTPAPSGS